MLRIIRFEKFEGFLLFQKKELLNMTFRLHLL